MPSYWWECTDCKAQIDFESISGTKGIAHFIWDVLIPSDWDQSSLVKRCVKCGKDQLRISHIFPRKDKIELQVKHIVSVNKFERMNLKAAAEEKKV